MGSVVVLGERDRVAAFTLTGAQVVVAEDADAVVVAWRALAGDVSVVVLTPAAERALGVLADQPPHPDRPLTVVMPPSARDAAAPAGSKAP